MIRLENRNFLRRAVHCAVLIIAVSVFAFNAQAEEGTFKVGLVDYLSGPAAQAFGVPALHGAELLIDKLNAGEVPAPYDKIGFGGMKIKYVKVDEAGGAQTQLQRFRDLVQRQNVDAILGYDGSGDCLAIAPLAEKLKALTVFSGCGTPRVFEESTYKYVFRAGAHSTMDNVALARYVADHFPDAKTVAGINQNYSWGQDSWRDFKLAIKQLRPDMEIIAALFPQFGAGQYGAQISTLLRKQPDIIHSSLWGGDLEAFLLQAGPRGLFRRSHVIFANAEHVLPRLSKKVPEGLITGGRGTVGYMRPDTELADWFYKSYERRYDTPPTQAPFRFAQTILGLKTAIEASMAENSDSRPSTQEIIAKLEGSEYETPSGKIRMKLANGHQAVQSNAIGVAKWNAKKQRMDLVNVEIYGADCVNPPKGFDAVEWIKQGFPGAECE